MNSIGFSFSILCKPRTSLTVQVQYIGSGCIEKSCISKLIFSKLNTISREDAKTQQKIITK